jgi:cytochrome o ubiquinol oxidase subunit 2
MTIVVIPVFVLVPLFAWRYRRKNPRAQYRPHWAFSGPLEIAIWGIPVAVVGVLAYLVVTRETLLDPYAALPSEKPALEVQVIGLNWKWLFIYPEQHIATVGVVAFAAERPVHFMLTSDTVMQSFFIPALGSPIYAMAGMVTQLNLASTKPGTVEGENTQFNGEGFQHQHFAAIAMTAQDFQNWVEKVRSQGAPLDDGAYRQLSEAGTAEAANASVGGDRTTTSIRYFSRVAPDFFDKVVDKYRNPMALSHMRANR